MLSFLTNCPIFKLISLTFFIYIFTFPTYAIEIKEVHSPSGIKAWLVQDKSVPVLSLNFAFRTGGTAYDPVGKEGLARMVSAMLDEGAGHLNSRKFQLGLKDIAARVQFVASLDKFRGSLTTLKNNKEKAFRLLGLALNQPRFDLKPLERVRGQIISKIRRNAQDPEEIASSVWYKTVFPNHPYGQKSDGTIGSVEKIVYQDLQEFMRRHIVRESLMVAVAGDISPTELSNSLDLIFGNLPITGKPQKMLETKPRAKGKVIIIDHNIPQSTVLFGHAGIKREHPDWYIATVMNHILGGGGFSSRLMSEVREKRGLAYSVYSFLNPFDHASLYMGKVATANQRVKKSIKVIREEWTKFAENGATKREVSAAKTYLNGSFPLRLTSTRGISRLLLAIQVNNLGINYFYRRKRLINAVSVRDIKRVAKSLLRPKNLTIVIVGKPKGIDFVNQKKKESFE